MYTWHEIKKQQFNCWSDQFITNLNQGNGEGEKVDRKQKLGVFIGSNRKIVTIMGPMWFIVQPWIFSSGGCCYSVDDNDFSVVVQTYL